MFTIDDMEGMEQTQLDDMPDHGAVERQASSSDGFGGKTVGAKPEDNRTTIHARVSARVTKAQTQAMGGQSSRQVEIEKWTLRFPLGTDIQERDYFVWEEGGFTIQIDETKPRSYATVLSVMGERVK